MTLSELHVVDQLSVVGVAKWIVCMHIVCSSTEKCTLSLRCGCIQLISAIVVAAILKFKTPDRGLMHCFFNFKMAASCACTKIHVVARQSCMARQWTAFLETEYGRKHAWSCTKDIVMHGTTHQCYSLLELYTLTNILSHVIVQLSNAGLTKHGRCMLASSTAASVST
jgi:hypothetical protein